MENSVNWGIIAPGHIASKFAEALYYCHEKDPSITLKAVASRSLEKAESFADEYGFEKAYGSYEELFNDPEVNAVYIASPHTFHAEQAMQALLHGKNVVVEKPAAVNAGTLAMITELAEEKKLFFMEATWSCFNPVILDVMETIRSNVIGKVIDVNANFCFRNAYNKESRLFNPSLAGGALLDVGIYPVTFTMMCAKASSLAGKNSGFNFNESTLLEPRKTVSSARTADGVDLWNSISLSFADGMTSSLQSSVDLMPLENKFDAWIYGTKGYIKIPAFWAAQEAEVYTWKSDAGIEAEPVKEIKHPFEKNGYEYEIFEASSCIKKGLIESSLHSHSDSLSVLKVLDVCRSQWKLEYPFEKKQAADLNAAILLNSGNGMENKTVKESSSSDSPLIIYTDGGCSGNPGPGGWGCVLIDGSNEMTYSGGEDTTTNNRMELMAAINALSKAAESYKSRKIEVYSDSQYVKNGITSWISSWKKNGWKTSAKKPVMNQDLWMELDVLYNSLNVEWKWVKGHAGVKYNEICDQLCQKEIHNRM